MDDYAWLREKENPEVRAYLECENAYAEAMMAGTVELQEELYREMLARIQETDVSAPYAEGGWIHFSRTFEGKQYAVRCRLRRERPHTEAEWSALVASLANGEGEVTLDLNALAEGQPYLDLGLYNVSGDARLLAYSLDTKGFRQYTLHVKDLVTGEELPVRAERVTSAAWAADDRTLFYTVEDEVTKRSHRLYRLRPGAAPELLLEEADERFNVAVSGSRSRELLLFTSASHTTSEVRFLRASDPLGAWTLVEPRRPDHEYYVDHRGDALFIRTNDRGRNFRLVTAPLASPGAATWTEVVPHRDGAMLEHALLFRGHAALFLLEGGLPRVEILDLASGRVHDVAFEEPVYAVFPGPNRTFDSPLLRFVYESPVTPDTAYEYDMATRERVLVKRRPVPGGYDPARYACERLFATATDGVKVPITVVARRDVPRDGTAPLYLNGYGSYGYPNPVTFSSNLASLLDRGVIFAEAHVRGGGELGKPWHDDGRMLKKRNTFTDFIAAAEHLVAQRTTRPDRLVIGGRSAGGLLIGAVVNMRPDLFGAALLVVPFVDVLNTMLDASLPLTVGEYEEWGNPNIPEEYEAMRAYCPYTNLAAKAYPALLVKTSFHDSQVMYWEPAKYVAKLRTLKTDANPVLFKTDMSSGHGGSSGRYDYLREVAFDTAFILWRVGKA